MPLKWTVMWNFPSWDTHGGGVHSTPAHIASLASTANGEVQCPSSELAGRRRGHYGKQRRPGVHPSHTWTVRPASS